MPAQTHAHAGAHVGAPDEAEAYRAALANLLQAAGVAAAIAPEAADILADVGEKWHDGRREDAAAILAAGCRKLREIRRLARGRAPQRPSPEPCPCLPGMEDAAEAEKDGESRASAGSAVMACRLFLVNLRAASRSYIHAGDPCDAVRIAASHLCDHVTYARVAAQKDLL